MLASARTEEYPCGARPDGAEPRSESERNAMQTEYSKCKTASDRKALAEKIAKLRADGAKYDGEGGIVAQGLVASATQARALLRSVATSTAPLAPGKGTEGEK